MRCLIDFSLNVKKQNIICVRNMDNLNNKYFDIGDKRCKYKESSTRDGNCYLIMICENDSDEDNTVPDLFILRIKLYPDNFWIIPKQKLIEEGIIISNSVKYITRIYLPIPGYTNKGRPWLNYYLNNYDLLKSTTYSSSTGGSL
jgi:hypothetical protein